jgi:hypothetical protein
LGCSFEICQWCGEAYFAGAEVLLDVYLPQIRRRDRHMSTETKTKHGKESECWLNQPSTFNRYMAPLHEESEVTK